MSILIEGMEMPTRCFSCPMCEVDNAEVNCAISHGSYIEYREVDPKVAIQERPSWCPLVPVPPHGDLIDVDAIMRLFYVRSRDGKVIGMFPSVDISVIKNAPVVIPADMDSAK